MIAAHAISNIQARQQMEQLEVLKLVQVFKKQNCDTGSAQSRPQTTTTNSQRFICHLS